MNLEQLMIQHGDAVRRVLRPSIALRTGRDVSCRSSVGGSRMLVRFGESWPEDQGEPMLLLAQIDFAECAGLIEGLPAAGVLQAFITRGDLPVMGETDLVTGAARLRILPQATPLTWIESPVADSGYPVGFEVVQTMPEFGVEDLTEEENDLLLYKAFWAEGHRMLGYPCPVQYDVLDTKSYNPSGNRVLALQIDGDEALGWHWVDRGALYFLADGKALAEGRLEDVLFEMQFM